jgi:hypothetical protein
MEKPVTFGQDSSLLGVLNPARNAGDVCCLLFNAGIVHRVGPHRLNVKLARALAEASIASLRFDLSGRGDSRPSAGAASYDQQAVNDLRAAMDFVERESGQRRFVIFGICSGAVNAYEAALADPRVAGILMVDGFWYRTRRAETMRLWMRFRSLSMKEVLTAFLRRLRRSAGKTEPAAPERGAGIFAPDADANPPKPLFASQLNGLTARGLNVFFLYTGSVSGLVSYAGQLRDAFKGEPFVKRVRCEVHPDLDHTAVSQHAQRRMAEIVRDWAVGIARARVPDKV